MKKLFYFMALFSLGSAHAGSETGNGGDIVVCNEANGSTSYELLDFYEGYNNYQVHANMPDGANYMEILKKTLNRIRIPEFGGMNRYLLNELKRVAAGFENDIVFTNEDLIDIPDHGHVFLAPNCKIKQAIIQHSNNDTDQREVIIDRKIWDRLSSKQKAGLALHEVIYFHALGLRQTNSQQARKATFFLASNEEVRMEKFIDELLLEKDTFRTSCKKLVGLLGANKINYDGWAREYCAMFFLNHRVNRHIYYVNTGGLYLKIRKVNPALKLTNSFISFLSTQTKGTFVKFDKNSNVVKELISKYKEQTEASVKILILNLLNDIENVYSISFMNDIIDDSEELLKGMRFLRKNIRGNLSYYADTPFTGEMPYSHSSYINNAFMFTLLKGAVSKNPRAISVFSSLVKEEEFTNSLVSFLNTIESRKIYNSGIVTSITDAVLDTPFKDYSSYFSFYYLMKLYNRLGAENQKKLNAFFIENADLLLERGFDQSVKLRTYYQNWKVEGLPGYGTLIDANLFGLNFASFGNDTSVKLFNIKKLLDGKKVNEIYSKAKKSSKLYLLSPYLIKNEKNLNYKDVFSEMFIQAISLDDRSHKTEVQKQYILHIMVEQFYGLSNINEKLRSSLIKSLFSPYLKSEKRERTTLKVLDLLKKSSSFSVWERENLAKFAATDYRAKVRSKAREVLDSVN